MDFKPRGKPRLWAFKEFQLKNGVRIGVFQGERGKDSNIDILVKYQEPGGRIRTPQHLHWAIDLLIKKEHKPELVHQFVAYLLELYDKVTPFANKQEQQECRLKFATSEDLDRFAELEGYGEYSVEFLAYIFELLSTEEKNADQAFMFRGVLEAIRDNKDIFSIVSAARYSGQS